MEYTLEELAIDAERIRQGMTSRLKRQYALCRKLGFNSSESVALMGKAKSTIRELAIARGFIEEDSDLSNL